MKKGKILLSGLLSLAAFSLFTTVNAESYVVSELPEEFTTRSAGRVSDALAIDENKDATLVNRTIITLNGNTQGRNIIDYHTTTGLKTFCYNRIKDYDFGAVYKKDAEFADSEKGIAYIVANAENYYNNSYKATAVATANETKETVQRMELSWMTQAAIWQYQDENFAAPTSLDNSIFEAGVQISGTQEYVYSTRANDLWKEAKVLVADAKNYKAGANDDAKLTFKFNGTYELDKDNKIIKTDLIEAENIHTGRHGIKLDLSQVPEGTKVFDSDGNEISTSEAFLKPFYLVIPVDNVDEYSFDFDISASTDDYYYYTGYKYVRKDGTDKQPLLLVTEKNKTITGGIHFEGSHIDDTASIISNSIYFVGFLILIAGVAMIYVNVRPQVSKEQI